MRSTSHLGLAAACVIVGLAAGARAQNVDLERYRALVSECEAFTARARAVHEAGDDPMGAVYLDLGRESCDQARALVRIAWPGLDAAQRAAAFDEIFPREVDLITLLVAFGDCGRAGHVLAETLNLVAELPEPWVAEAGRTSHAVLRCLPIGGLDASRRWVLTPGGDEVRLMGELAAFVWQSNRFESCRGVFPYPPTYRLEVVEPGALSVELEATGDWRLAVAGADTLFCGSGASGVWTAEGVVGTGFWDVYVGWGEREPANHQFGIAFSLRPTGSTDGGPSHGVAHLAPATPRAELRGHTLGEGPASARFGPACGGVVPLVPNHRLDLSEEGDVEVRVSSPMSTELTLVVAGEGVTACAGPDATGETLLSRRLPAGVYDVLVGEPTPWGTGYDISFALLGVEAPPTWRLGALTLPEDGAQHVFEGTVPEAREATRRPDCAGFYRTAPDVEIEVTESGDWGFMVRAERDAALVVVGPHGPWCNRDWGSSDPGIFRRLEPGLYQVFVGAEAAPSGFPFELTIASD